eukprot:1416026-Amphidinium_carterae.2
MNDDKDSGSYDGGCDVITDTQEPRCRRNVSSLMLLARKPLEVHAHQVSIQSGCKSSPLMLPHHLRLRDETCKLSSLRG